MRREVELSSLMLAQLSVLLTDIWSEESTVIERGQAFVQQETVWGGGVVSVQWRDGGSGFYWEEWLVYTGHVYLAVLSIVVTSIRIT